MKTSLLKINNRLISFLLSILGFAAASSITSCMYGSPVVEYGTPHATFKVKGSVQTEVNADALPNIRVVMGEDTAFTTCANQRNISELPELYDLLLRLGLKEWRIFTIFPIGRASHHENLQLEPKEFKGLFDFVESVRNEGKIKLNYGCEGFLGNYEGRVRDNFFFCRAGINVASILVDGSISACPNLRENFIQGSIYKDSFKDVWLNKYSIYRDRSWKKTGVCADCDFFTNCEGNGMHLRDEKTGELLFCHLNRIEEGERIITHA